MAAGFREVYRAFIILIIASLSAVWVPSLFAEDLTTPPTIVLEVRPEQVNLHGTRPSVVVVVARNQTAETLRDLTLSWLTSLELEVSGDDLSGIALPPFAEISWTLLLTPTAGTTLSGEIDFRLDYSWQPADIDGPIPRVQLASLTVASAARPTLDQVATLKVDATTSTINEQQPGTLYLLLGNVYGAPVTIDELAIETAGSLTITYPKNQIPMTLDPGDQVSIPLTVIPGDRVQPGGHLLLIKTPISWRHNGEVLRGTLAATQTIEVGVLGESDILTLLGVPTLLFLPGFLIIFTMRMGWLWGKSAEEKKNFPLSPLKIDFWFFAIITSLVAAAVYPLATTWLGNPRDFLQGYGLIDIYYIFAGSVLFGAITIAAARAFVFLRSQSQAQREVEEAAKVPTADDLPDVTLNRLRLQGLDLNRPRVRIRLDKDEITIPVFLLEPQGKDGDEIWVGPGIDIPDAGLTDELYDQIDAIRQSGTDVQGFLALMADHDIPLRWDERWPLSGPTLLAREKILEYQNSEVIIRLP